MPKLDKIPSNWDIIPTIIGIKQNEPQIYLEYNIEDNQKVKHRRVRIPVRALKNRENSLSAYEIAIQLSKQYSRYLEKISINQIERIVKLIQNKEVLTKKFMKIDKINNKEINRSIDFKNNKSFVLNDDDDNIYNFSTPTRSLLSLNSLQPPSFLHDNVSFSEPNISKSSNKLLGSSLSLNDVLVDNKNDNQILNKLRNHVEENELDSIDELKDNDFGDDNSDTEKEDNKEKLRENDYSMNSFENDSILNSMSKKEELSENNKDLQINNYNYDQSFEQDFESIEEDFEEISESELNTENDYPGEEQNEDENSIKKREIPKAITPNESEDEDDEDIDEEVEEIVEEVKKEVKDNDDDDSKIEKEENFDDILISDISRNDISLKENKKISNNTADIEESEALESIIENVNVEGGKVIDEDLNKVSESELIAKKKEMDILFMKNQIKPGDPNYQYDIQKSFSIDADAEADWDDSSESVSDKLINDIKEKEMNNFEKEDNDESILKLVDRNTEIEKWNKIDINSSNKTSLTPINQIINKNIDNDNDNDDEESESISEDISIKSSNEDDSDFKVDPPKFINNQINPINNNNKSPEDELSVVNKLNNNNKIGLIEMNDEEIVSDSLESDSEENISLKNNTKNIVNENISSEHDYSKMFINSQKKAVQDDTFSFLKMDNLSGSTVALNVDKSNKRSGGMSWLKQLSLNKGEDDDEDDEDDEDDDDEDYDNDDNNNNDNEDKENENSLTESNSEISKSDDEEEIEEDISIDINDQSKIENKSLDMGSLIDVKHQSVNEGLDSIIPNFSNLKTNSNNIINNNVDNNNINNLNNKSTNIGIDNDSSLFQKTNNTFDKISSTNKFNNDDDSENILDLIGDTESLDSFNNEDFEYRNQDYSEDFEAGFTDDNME